MSMSLSLFVVRFVALRPPGSAGTVPAKTGTISHAVRRTATNGHRVSGGARTSVRAHADETGDGQPATGNGQPAMPDPEMPVAGCRSPVACFIPATESPPP